MDIKFCSACGAPMEKRVPEDDDHVRAVCTECEHVYYENPKMVVGCIPVMGDRVLMCKRNIEPKKGMWTLPAGYLETGESVQDGAKRETLEETRSKVRIIDSYRLFNITFVGQIYMMFRAELLDESFGPTSESIQVSLFEEDEIPWNEIAFDVIRQTLVDYFNDRKKGQGYCFKIKDINQARSC